MTLEERVAALETRLAETDELLAAAIVSIDAHAAMLEPLAALALAAPPPKGRL